MSDPFYSCHLPRGVTADSSLESLMARNLACRYPRPTARLLVDTIAALRTAAHDLAERPVAEIVRIVDAAAARLCDPADALRQRAEAWIPAATGYSPAMARLVLDRMAADWRTDALNRLLEAELGDPAVLDRFRPAGPHRATRAYGPGLSFHIFAGNVPGVAVTALVRSLLVKSPVLAKLASGEPVLPVLFAQAVASVDAGVGDALAVTYWPGGAPAPEAEALRAADLVVVYGGDDVVASVRQRARPDQRLVVHGPRFSAGVVTAAALEQDVEAVADQVARSVAWFDQHGCVSPHAVWVEDPQGDRTAAFVDAVAAALRRLERDLPRGDVDAAEASRIHQERGAAELRGHAGQPVRVVAGEGTGWTVVVDADPTFRPSCLNRFLFVLPVPRLQPAIDALIPHGPYLQSVAVAGTAETRTRLAGPLAAVGATRVTTFERLPWPPPEWHHDGHGPLNELLRWVDLEH